MRSSTPPACGYAICRCRRPNCAPHSTPPSRRWRRINEFPSPVTRERGDQARSGWWVRVYFLKHPHPPPGFALRHPLPRCGRGKPKRWSELMSYLDKSALKVVGTRPVRPDGVDKVIGRASFGADMTMPGMLWGKVLRSPHAHARIVSIDTSKAKALPGVRAAVT